MYILYFIYIYTQFLYTILSHFTERQRQHEKIHQEISRRNRRRPADSSNIYKNAFYMRLSIKAKLYACLNPCSSVHV